MKINEVIERSEYDFLMDNEHLGKNIMFVTFGGSHAYGTNTESSDIDIRGVAMNRPSEILGFQNFEQYENRTTDTVIYGVRKFVSLLAGCNPNIIELLGCRPETYAMVSQSGKMLLANKELFLSQKAASSFCGYAFAQLKRLQYGMKVATGDSMNQMDMKYLSKSAMAAYKDYILDHPESAKSEVTLNYTDTDVYINGTLKDMPIAEFASLGDIFSRTSKQYEMNHRNRKPIGKVDKHAMHLVRLYYMGIDILEKGVIQTYREKEHDELMAIRNGKYRNEDGTYQEEFFEYVRNLEERLNYAKKESVLPKIPDMKKIEELLMEINMMALKKGNEF